MDEDNGTDGGGGDGNSSSSKTNKSKKTNEQFDAERAHEENAKRCKTEEDVTDDNDPTTSDNNGSCEASTSSSDKGDTTKGKKRDVGEKNRKNWLALSVLDSDDDPDEPDDPEEHGDVVDEDDNAINAEDDDEEIVDDPDYEVPRARWATSKLLVCGRVPHSNRNTRRRSSNHEGSSDAVVLDNSSGNDSDSEVDEKPPIVLEKPKPRHNWFIVPEIQTRQFGASAHKQSSELFQRRCYGSLHCVERLELMYKLEKHSGCVNSINFHPNGELLASGSDDLDIVLWDWKLGNPLLSFDSKHKSNVFQSKFLPLSGDLHIVSCARDGQVRLAQVSAQEGLRNSRRLGSHRGPSHKLTVLHDQPQVVISVGEDGLILKHDLRSPKSEKIYTVRLDDFEVPLYSISSNPLNSHEYCVAGRDFRVRSYDHRKGTDTLNTYRPFDKAAECQKSLTITCAVYNHNGSEILASYNDEDIYLFDVNGTPGTYIHSYQGHRNGATIKGVNFFGPKSEYVISGSDCGYVYFWDKDSGAIVQWLRADDNGIVNCLEAHPQLPFLCTSGLDHDIKVWVPSYEHDPTLSDLSDTVKRNLKLRSEWTLGSHMGQYDADNTQMLWILWRQLTNSTDHIRRVINLSNTDEQSSNNQSSNNSSSSSSSTLSTIDSSASPFDDTYEDDSDGPGGCATS